MEKILDVSRYTNVTELQFEVEFITPCFLGGADGNAEIRTAPFKNLFRRWWRIANGNLSPEELWKRESRLFGSTENDPDVVASNKNKRPSEREPEVFGKSKVGLCIVNQKIKYQNDQRLRFPKHKITHPEVNRPMYFETYLGMGPIFWNKEKKCSEYKYLPILENSSISMRLNVPKSERSNFITILSLIHHYGTIGSRSRNGWGSLAIKDLLCDRVETKLKSINEMENLVKDINELISQNNTKKYPSYIAKDQKGILLWNTDNHKTWQDAMKQIAQVYVNIRTEFKFTNNDALSKRHLLGYPITHHGAKEWDIDKKTKKKQNARLPSQLCIKIIRDNNEYRGQIIHIPNLIPLVGFSCNEQLNIWKEVYSSLDKKLQRSKLNERTK